MTGYRELLFKNVYYDTKIMKSPSEPELFPKRPCRPQTYDRYSALYTRDSHSTLRIPV